MLSSAPGDATLASLLVGVGAGVSFALLSLLALTHTPAQWAAYAAWICTHGWGAAQAAIALAVLALLGRVALCRLSTHAVLPPAERLAARRRNLAHLPAHFPNGWLRLCDSADAPMGVTQHVRLCGLDVALYRALGESPSRSGRGRVFALDAVCPHLGANMGAGGKVVGNALECPFHGWQFAGKDGVCQSIPYAAKIPSNAKVATWSVAQHSTVQRSAALRCRGRISSIRIRMGLDMCSGGSCTRGGSIAAVWLRSGHRSISHPTGSHSNDAIRMFHSYGAIRTSVA